MTSRRERSESISSHYAQASRIMMITTPHKATCALVKFSTFGMAIDVVKLCLLDDLFGRPKLLAQNSWLIMRTSYFRIEPKVSSSSVSSR